MKQVRNKLKADIEQRYLTRSQKVLAGAIIAVCAAVLFVHWPALSAKATFVDDEQYLLRNFTVQNPSWVSAKQFLVEVLKPSTVKGYYQPLSMISLMVDCAFGGSPQNFKPFHVTSLILHLANTALIIVLLWLLFKRPWIAAGAGLLFGLHPLTVEPISWISERKTLLAAFFVLWSLVLYVRSVRRGNSKIYLSCVLTYALALMSKPTSTPLPVLMLLMDYWPLRRLKWRTVLEKLPLFFIGGISAVITFISQSRSASVIVPHNYNLALVPLVICHNIIFYLYKMVWPANLSPYYAIPDQFGFSAPMVIISAIGTCILIMLLVLSLRWTRAALTGWLIFFVAIFPTMQILQFSDVIASDKFAYLPSIGLLMILAAFLGWICCSDGIPQHTAKCIVVAILVLMLAGAESFATRRYLTHWRDTATLCEHTLSMSPKSPIIRRILYRAYFLRGDIDKGIEQCRQTLRYESDNEHAFSYNDLGIALWSQGRKDEAIVCLNKAIEIDPNYSEAHYNLGKILQMQGKDDEAIKHFYRAIGNNAYYPEVYNALGLAFQKQDKLDKAVECYYKALEIAPGYAKAHNNLGLVFLKQNKLEEAIGHFQAALRINPNFTEAQLNLEQAIKTRHRDK
ncbi:MAG: tetratricopeptide repeat protein [Sedimentisphaerales bacterium]|jgi:Flp pilus assembly protein TadD